MGLVALGELLRSRRYERGWTQEQLEEYSGVSQNYISKLENGAVKRPGKEILESLAASLGLSMDEIKIAMGWVVVGEPEEVIGDIKLVEIPFYGLVPADTKRYTAAIERDEMRHVPEPYIQGVREPFALQVSGDCLAALEIFSGDIVVCERYQGQPITDGKVVAVRFGDELTLKRWFSTSEGAELRDGNGTIIDQLNASSHFTIEGIVVGHYREFTRL